MPEMYYRTRDGEADYKFSFEEQPEGDWLPFILAQPGYQGRDTACDPTHRLIERGRHYVCWTDPLDTLEDARAVAAMWADRTQEYIRTGKKF